MQTCRSINVHVVNTDNNMLRPTWMFMDSMRKQTHQCAQYKLKIVYKTWQQKHSVKLFFYKKIKILGFPWCSTRENLSIDASITNVGLILTKKIFNSKLKIRSFEFWLLIKILHMA